MTWTNLEPKLGSLVDHLDKLNYYFGNEPIASICGIDGLFLKFNQGQANTK